MERKTPTRVDDIDAIYVSIYYCVDDNEAKKHPEAELERAMNSGLMAISLMLQPDEPNLDGFQYPKLPWPAGLDSTSTPMCKPFKGGHSIARYPDSKRAYRWITLRCYYNIGMIARRRHSRQGRKGDSSTARATKVPWMKKILDDSDSEHREHLPLLHRIYVVPDNPDRREVCVYDYEKKTFVPLENIDY